MLAHTLSERPGMSPGRKGFLEAVHEQVRRAVKGDE